MSVSLRLSRGGSKKRPFFRIVAADIRSPRDGKYLERLGVYNPMRAKDDPERVNLNIERIKYWLSVGARPTERVTKFLAKEGLAEKPIVREQTKQDKPKKKTLEKLKVKEEKLKSKQEMEKAAQAEPKVEAPSTSPEPPKTEQPSTPSTSPEPKAEAATEPPKTEQPSTPSTSLEPKAEAATEPPKTEQPSTPSTSPEPKAEAEAATEPPKTEQPAPPEEPKINGDIESSDKSSENKKDKNS